MSSTDYKFQRNLRLQNKKITAGMVVRSNLAKFLVNALIEVDDVIQDVATFNLNISPDNLVSKTVRKIFDLRAASDLSLPSKEAASKSRWHEIVQKVENQNAAAKALREQAKKEIARTLEPLPYDLEAQLLEAAKKVDGQPK